jgi:hypothetical protein
MLAQDADKWSASLICQFQSKEELPLYQIA